jgi:hypothetical protein
VEEDSSPPPAASSRHPAVEAPSQVTSLQTRSESDVKVPRSLQPQSLYPLVVPALPPETLSQHLKL